MERICRGQSTAVIREEFENSRVSPGIEVIRRIQPRDVKSYLNNFPSNEALIDASGHQMSLTLLVGLRLGHDNNGSFRFCWWYVVRYSCGCSLVRFIVVVSVLLFLGRVGEIRCSELSSLSFGHFNLVHFELPLPRLQPQHLRTRPPCVELVRAAYSQLWEQIVSLFIRVYFFKKSWGFVILSYYHFVL